MKFFSAAAITATSVLAASAVSAASNGTFYTTEVVTAYTTYCPSATTFAQNNKTYTVSSATTVTVTNCPCTITRPVTSQPPSHQTPAPPKTITSISHFKGAGAVMLPEGVLAGGAAALMGLVAVLL